jgi:hypothetical protein
MPLEISSLRELPPEKVEAMLATLAQLMQENHPEVELTRGAFHDLVLYFNSVLNAAVRENIERVLQSRSLLQINAQPELADDDLVDHVLSNYNVLRDPGTPANGVATFVLTTPFETNVDPGIGYIANDVVFFPTAAFLILPPGATARNETEKVMVAVGDGTYAANIPLRASEIGGAGNIERGTKLLPQYIPNNVLSVFAASNFIGGRDAANNYDYLKKLSTGLAAKTIGGRKSYEAFLRANQTFENLLHCSVLGAGDAEQQRDQHGLLPISSGGKVDVYIQTSPYAAETTQFLRATYVGPAATGTTWQIAIDRETAAGFYEIARVAAVGDNTANSHLIISEIRGVNFDNIAYVSDIKYLHESAYTRYQTAVIQFEDRDTLAEDLIPNVSIADYAVTLRHMPLVGDAHDLLTSRDNRARGTDILVKAAVPCFTKISFVIQTETNEPLTAGVEAAIKKEIVKAVAGVGFSGQLHSSIISGAAHKHLVGRQAIREIDMFGRIRRPDGTVAYLRDKTLLSVPDDPQRLVTGRTTAFLVGETDISISVAAAGFTD